MPHLGIIPLGAFFETLNPSQEPHAQKKKYLVTFSAAPTALAYIKIAKTPLKTQPKICHWILFGNIAICSPSLAII